MKGTFQILIFLLVLGLNSCRDEQQKDEFQDGTVGKDTTDNILQRTSKKMDSDVNKSLDKQIEEMGKDSLKVKKNNNK